MKKTYQIPSVIAMQLIPSSIICVSGGIGNGGTTGSTGTGDPLPGE